MNVASVINDADPYSTLVHLSALATSVFLAGWFLHSRLKKICAESNEELENIVTVLGVRITTLEKDALKVSQYEKDMEKVCNLIEEIKDDFKMGINTVTSRIDNLSMIFSRPGKN